MNATLCFLIFGAALLAACALAINRNARLQSRCTARARGKVLTRRESSLDDGPIIYSGTAEFRVNGATCACEYSTCRKPGASILIRYDPKDPATCFCDTGTVTKGGRVLDIGAVLGLILLLIGLCRLIVGIE